MSRTIPSPMPRAVATRLAACAAVAAVLFAVAGPAAPGHALETQAAAKRCADVPFTPNSDDVAANVRATRVSCRTARAFIRSSHGHPGRRHRGFTCTATPVEGAALPQTRYRCVRGSQRLRWDRS